MSHAFLSPSAHSRWSTCPGAPTLAESSVRPSDRDVSSKAAAWGTEAHDLAASMLERGFTPRHYTDPEMLAMCHGYVDYVRAREDMHIQSGALSVILNVEQRVPLCNVTGEIDAHGTADVILKAVYSTGTVVDVIDLKTGREPVSAQGNGQLISYALGALDWLQDQIGELLEVNLIIYQPRLGAPREWRPSLAELHQHREAIQAAGKLALSLRGKPEAAKKHLKPTPKGCHWCPVKPSCPALQRIVEKEVLQDFTPTDDLAEKLRRVELVEQWSQSVRAEALRRLQMGETVAGYKLVQGRGGPRQWASEEELKAYWEAAGYPSHTLFEEPKVKSPTQVEKMLGKQKFRQLPVKTIQSEGKPEIALDSDTRPAYDPAPFKRQE